nr:MAG TPA: hypothetical protein [Ackermannviridae sp.]
MFSSAFQIGQRPTACTGFLAHSGYVYSALLAEFFNVFVQVCHNSGPRIVRFAEITRTLKNSLAFYAKAYYTKTIPRRRNE